MLNHPYNYPLPQKYYYKNDSVSLRVASKIRWVFELTKKADPDATVLPLYDAQVREQQKY